MTTTRKDWPSVRLTAWQMHDVVTMDWEVSQVRTTEVRARRVRTRRVHVSFPALLDAWQLTEMLGKMAAYVLRDRRGTRRLPATIGWSESPGPFPSVPPGSGGRGVEEQCPYCGRTADVQAAEQALPSLCAAPGGVRGTSEASSAQGSEPPPPELPGQLALPGLDGA